MDDAFGREEQSIDAPVPAHASAPEVRPGIDPGLPPLRVPERMMPPMPDPEDAEAMRRWRRLCEGLRNLFGSGN